MRKPGGDRPHRSLLRRLRLFFVPGFFRRFDSYLLQNRPVVWRSRVHYMIMLSMVLANALLFLLGFLYPVNRQNAPTIEDVANLVALLHLMGAAVLLYWAYLQHQHPMGVWTIWTYLVTCMLYFTCIFSVIINPISFALPVVHHIAAVVPADSFIADYEFHQRYGFWKCNAGITHEIVETHRPRIQRDLEKYGLSPAFTFRDGSRFDYSCIPGAPSLESSTPDGKVSTTLFGDRLQSIKAAQQFVIDRSGVFFDAYVGSIATYLSWSFLFAVVLLAATIPRHVWLRRFEHYGLNKPLPDRLPQPPFLSRLDQRLLVARPLVWSTRAHSFVFNSTVYAMIVATIVGGLSHVTQLRQGILGFSGFPRYVTFILGISQLIGIMALVTLPVGIWAYQQSKRPICTASTWRSQLVLTLYIALSVCFSHLEIILLSVFIAMGRDVAVILIVVFLFGNVSLVGLGFLRNYGTFHEVLGAFCALLCVVFLHIFYVIHYSYLPLVIDAIVWFAFSLLLIIANIRKRTTRILATLARIYIAVLPAFLFSVLFAVAENAKYLVTWVGLAVEEALVMEAAMLCAIPLYGIVCIPATRMLVNHKYQPKDW